MIHGAKLLNKNKYTRLSVLKNKKIRKKFYIKFEKRQRSIRHQKKGCGLIFAQYGKTAWDTRAKWTFRTYIIKHDSYK